MSNYLKELCGISKATHNSSTVLLGKPGSGKTTVAGTFPKPLLLISLGKDGGAEVLRGYKDDEVQMITLDNDAVGSNSMSLYQKLMSLLDELKGNKHFKSVVIDPYTSVQESLVNYMTLQKGKMLTQQEYGVVGKLMLDMRDKIDTLATGDVEYVLVCHIKENSQTDSITGEQTKELVPKMTINNGKILLEHPSAVLYCCKKTVLDNNGVGAVKFLTYVGGHPNIDTKFRTANGTVLTTGKYYENFSYEKMKKLYDGEALEDEKTLNVVEPTGNNPFEDEKTNNDEGEW